MRLTLDALETLDAIEQQGSFAKAAEVLHRVPSAVTYTVQKLESDLGVALFDRSGKRARLTDAGQALLERGRILLRDAENLENLVKRVSHGWELQLTLAVDDLVPMAALLPIIAEFDAQSTGTRIRLTREILSGAWDALIDRRADLAIGATGEMPAGHGLESQLWCEMSFVFAVAAHHPLAEGTAPLSIEELVRYRAIVASDSSRRLPPRSSGLFEGQETLVVPTLDAKLAAQRYGLGVGYLPRHLVLPELERGTMVVREIAVPRAPVSLNLGWRAGDEGRALAWFRARLADDHALQALLAAGT